MKPWLNSDRLYLGVLRSQSECNFSVKLLSVALGMTESSSKHEKIPMGFGSSMRSMVGCRSLPKSMNFHSICSRAYSSCSKTNMWWLKNC